MGNGFIHKLKPQSDTIPIDTRILGIEFSGSTYQIEVEDKEGNSFWPFFQFDEQGVLSDAFCSCGSDDEPCAHLSAAFLRIYHGHIEPLHIRFKKSFWNRLCSLFAEHLGIKALSKIDHQNHHFSIEAKTKEGKDWIHTLIDKRVKATPETSLKFSNLSQEEIAHWKEGRASPSLRYELSFWSDLAKHMMLMQEEKKHYTLIFEEIEGLPLKLNVEWKDFSLSFSYDPPLLTKIIPTLTTVDSPLKVHVEFISNLDSITYDEKMRCLHIKYKTKELSSSFDGKQIGDWTYVKEDGFYPTGKKMLGGKTLIEEGAISSFLSQHKHQIASYLSLHMQVKSLSHHLEFDREWCLHVETYLFERGDLNEEGSAFFGKWIYIKGKGFYAVKGDVFNTPLKVIPKENISSFVHYNRSFLNTQEGFTIHLASVESAITYSMSEKGLKFLSKFQEESLEAKDFGDWIYYRGQGFFPKKAPGGRDVLFVGLEVAPQEIHYFIRLNRDELELIPHFFAQKPIVQNRGLKISVQNQETIVIESESILQPEFREFPFKIFGDFIFVEGVGFSELPPSMRPPARFQEKLLIHEKEMAHFFEEEFKTLKPFIIHLDSEVEAPHSLILDLSMLEKDPLSGIKIDGDYISEKGSVSIQEILIAMKNQKRFLFSRAGRLDLQDERFSWIKQIKEGGVLSALDFFRLDIIEGVHVKNREAAHLLESLRSFTIHEQPDLKGLKSELRPYQQTGLHWLWFLYRTGLSGLLCDEMGLGKTHQAMALIAAIKNHKKGRFLIVAPTSVIYHWQEKLNDFLPELKVHFFHGLKRTLSRLPKSGILLTSYGILRSEKKAIEKIHFELAIFDEIQVAKNPSSRIHDALLSVEANMRLGLTGTPIENYLKELKALFDVILPSYMLAEKEFKETFVLPIEREGDAEKKMLLSRLIKPFILRRKKQEVLQELPEKTIDKMMCELTEEQQDLYRITLERERKSVVEQLHKGEAPIPYVHIFSILSKLKQVCDHPALLLKEPLNYKEHTSGKWELFTELLREAIESEQKVVVFSQYLQMLDIFESYLKEQRLNYAQIRGSTLDRKEQMDRFREDPRCHVFLGSLQAAGLGIDLTSASIVILYDRWWNAARENQAIDRVHRIGQKWGVQVYILVTKGTVEEKIDQIITRKGRLMEEIVTADDEATFKKFTREELIDLLSFSIKK